MKIKKGIKSIYDKLYDSTNRFPISLLYSAVTVIVLIYLNHLGYRDESREMYSRIAMTLALGIPLSLSLYMFFERKNIIKKQIRIIGHISIPIILTLFYFFFLKELEYISITRYIAYNIAFYILFSFIPFIKNDKSYESYVIRLFSRFIVTYVYSLVLYLGLAAILETINLLFNAGISGRIFGDIALIVAGIFAPAFFLADVPQKGEEVTLRDYPKVLRVLLQFIVLPLITVYTTILYVYFAKIIIIGELPKGIIGNLVLWYSIVSTIVLFFIYPLRKSFKWINNFVLIFPKAIIPLLGMMFVALGIRIKTYGITEDRYFVSIVGAWITGVMIYYSIKKNIRNIIITITLSIIAILAVTGPLSAYTISKWSQNQRFETILNKYNMINQASEIKKSEKEVEDKDQREISEIIQYFDKYHNLDEMRYLSDEFEIKDMKDIFGFRFKENTIGHLSNGQYYNYRLNNQNIQMDISDFDYFAEYDIYAHDKLNNKDKNYLVTFNNDDNQLIIKDDNNILYKKNLLDITNKIYQNNVNGGPLPQEEMTFIDENNHVKVKIIFKSINGYIDDYSDEYSIRGLKFYNFIKFKK